MQYFEHSSIVIVIVSNAIQYKRPAIITVKLKMLSGLKCSCEMFPCECQSGVDSAKILLVVVLNCITLLLFSPIHHPMNMEHFSIF